MKWLNLDDFSIDMHEYFLKPYIPSGYTTHYTSMGGSVTFPGGTVATGRVLLNSGTAQNANVVLQHDGIINLANCLQATIEFKHVKLSHALQADITYEVGLWVDSDLNNRLGFSSRLGGSTGGDVFGASYLGVISYSGGVSSGANVYGAPLGINYNLKLELTPTTITFYVNNSKVATINSNIPATVNLRPWVWVKNPGVDGVARTLQFDELHVSVIPTV